MSNLPFNRDKQESLDIIVSFLKNQDINAKNKEYVMRILKNIEKWNLGFILEKVEDQPLFFLTTNIIESENRVIKKATQKKKSC